MTHGVGQWHPADVFAAQRHHHPVLAAVCGVGSVDPEPGCQHPVIGGRRATTLHVAQDGDAHFLADPLFHFHRQLLGDAGEALVAELIHPAAAQLHRPLDGFGALGDHADEVRRTGLKALLDHAAHLLHVIGLLRDQRHMRTGGQPRVQCDPAGVATHHLNQHHPLMRLRGAVQTVNGLGGDLQSGVVAECHVGAVDVVVDGLGHPDHRNALLVEPVRGGQGALAADRDQHVDPVVLQRLFDIGQTGAQFLRVGPGGAEHGAALGQQSLVAVVVVELDAPVLQQAPPAVLESDHRGVVAGVAGPHHGADDGIEAGAVAAAGEDSDTHRFYLTASAPAMER